MKTKPRRFGHRDAQETGSTSENGEYDVQMITKKAFVLDNEI